MTKKPSYKLISLTIISLFLISTLSHAQSRDPAYNPQESDFINLTYGPARINLKDDYGVVDDNFTSDNSQALRDAIDDAAAAGGGIIHIPAGNYVFSGIKNIVSNIHITIDKDAIIRPNPEGKPEKFSMFLIADEQPRIENISITGVEGRFTVDLTQTDNPNIFVFGIKNVQNFKLSGFNILDRKTEFQSISIGPTKYNGTWYFPENGVVRDCDAHDCDYGFGLMQMQAGKNIFFENISCTGGIPLRLESGWTSIQGSNAKIEDIYARNIRCYNGQCAVFLSPHTMKQGYIDIQNITSVACEWGVKTENGYPTPAEAAKGLTPGYFDSNSVIAHINATYGHDAMVRWGGLAYIPCELRDYIGPWNDTMRCRFPAPSCAPVADFASQASRGVYQVRIWDIKHTGYLNKVPTIVNDYYDDFELCGPNSNGYIVTLDSTHVNTFADRFNINSLNAPESVTPGERANLSINYQAENNADIYFELMNYTDGASLISKKVSVPADTSSVAVSMTIPATISPGEYLWKVYITVADSVVEDDQRYADVIVENGDPICIEYTNPGISISNEANTWTTGEIDISCASSINLTMQAIGVGDMETADYLNIYYKLDDGVQISLLQITDSFSEQTISVDKLSGNTLEVIVNGYTSWKDETYTVSDISILGIENTGPVLSFIKPVNNHTYPIGSNIEVEVSATDNSNVSNVVLYLNGSLVGQENYAPYEWGLPSQSNRDLLLQNMTEGIYSLTAIATDDEGNTAEETIDVIVEGNSTVSATLTFRYALWSGSRTGKLLINDSSQDITFTSTGSWTTWGEIQVPVALNSNTSNIIRLESTGQDLANVDQMSVSTTNLTYQLEDASLSVGAIAESTNAGYLGSGYVNFPTIGGVAEITGVNGSNKANTSRTNIHEDISIYPNPFNNKLHINLPEEHGFISVELIDMSGKIIISHPIDRNMQIFSSRKLNNADRGVYLIRLIGNTDTYTSKILKY